MRSLCPFIFLLLLVIVETGCERNVTIIQEFPEEFSGTVVIVYSAPGFPALPRDHGNRLIRVPADGIVITSEPNYQGWARVESYFVDSANRRLRKLRGDEEARGGGVEIAGDLPGITTYITSIGTGPPPPPEQDYWPRKIEARRRLQHRSR